MIRQARIDEANVVADVVASAYKRFIAIIGTVPGPMLDDYAARIRAKQVWLLEDAGVTVGVLVLQDGPDCFLLDNIAVRPDRQGSGFGRLLLDFSEAEAMRCGWSAITLYTNVLMVENIAIYTARGYIEQGHRIEHGFHRVYMVKPLDS